MCLKTPFCIFICSSRIAFRFEKDSWNLWIRFWGFKSYCSTVHFCRITSIYQPKNAHVISHKTLLKHFKTLRHVSILSDHRQGALFLAKVMLQYSQFNWYLQTRCCGSISCCVGMCCGAVALCAHRATAPQHNMICCHNTSFANTNWIVNTVT